MKIKVLSVVGMIAIVLTTLFIINNNDDSTMIINESQGIKDLVNDYSVGNITDQSASITGEQLIVTDSKENQTIYKLPEDEFFVSIAPYIDVTHP